MRELTLEQARRVAVRAQWLHAPRPSDLVDVLTRLTLIQVDPTNAVAPSVDLVPWTRIGRSYQPVHMRHALDTGAVFELDGCVRPMSDLRLYLAEMALYPTREEARDWFEANEPFRHDILDRLDAEGPLLSREIPDTSVVGWHSTGWTNNRNVTMMLEFLLRRGEVAIAGRLKGQRLWDVAERVYPDTVAVPLEEARRIRAERRLASLGIVRTGDVGEPVTVAGVDGVWWVEPSYVDEPFVGRTALLSPFDRLVYDRARLLDLFGFEYVLEMYKPKAARRWGYFALPILHLDRLVGKVDATADRRAGVLRVDAIHEDLRFTKAITNAVQAELGELAAWLGLRLVAPSLSRGS